MSRDFKAWTRAFHRLARDEPRPPAPGAPEPIMGTVKALNPLRIALDNDPLNVLPYSPPCFNAYPTTIGERVFVQTWGRQVVIVGVLVPSAPVPKAFAVMYKTNGFQNPTGHFNTSAFISLDWQNAVVRGNIGVQGAAGHGEIMIKKSGWYQVTASLYLTGSGTGLNYLNVERWFGDFQSVVMLSNNRTQNANDEQTYLSAIRYFDAGMNLSLKFAGPTHTWGDSNRRGTYLSVMEI